MVFILLILLFSSSIYGMWSEQNNKADSISIEAGYRLLLSNEGFVNDKLQRLSDLHDCLLSSNDLSRAYIINFFREYLFCVEEKQQFFRERRIVTPDAYHASNAQDVFIEAIARNNGLVVQFLLKHEPNLIAKMHSSLATAMRHGSTEVARILVQNGADLFNRMYPLLHIAAQNNHQKAIAFLMSKGLDPEQPVTSLAHEGRFLSTFEALKRDLEENEKNKKALERMGVRVSSSQEEVDVAWEKGIYEAIAFMRAYKEKKVDSKRLNGKPDVPEKLVDNTRSCYAILSWQYEQAKKHDNKWQIAVVLAQLGKLHYFGIGVAKDCVIARRYFESAAEQDDNKWARAEAWIHLGNLYHFGLGVARDDVRARGCYERAEKQEDNQWAQERARANLLILERDMNHKEK